MKKANEPHSAYIRGGGFRSPPAQGDIFPCFFGKKEQEGEWQKDKPYTPGEGRSREYPVAPGMIDDEYLQQKLKAYADEDQPVRKESDTEGRLSE